MRHYVLFNPLKPEDLSLIKELTRKGKALGGPCGSAVVAKTDVSCGKLGAGAAGGRSSEGSWRLQGEP